MSLKEIQEPGSLYEEKVVRELAPEVEAEIQRFEREIARVESGELDPDDFRKFRLENGIYGIRGTMEDRKSTRLNSSH